MHYFGRGIEWRKSAALFAILLSVLVAARIKAEGQNIRYDVKVEKRYFLAEKIPAAFSIINVGPGVVKVKDAAMLKISMELKGPVNGERVEVRKYTYDGRQGVAMGTPPEDRADGMIIWYAPTFVKKPDVSLRTGQSTNKKFDDLLDVFRIEKGAAPGIYTLTVWFDDRQMITKKFRVETDGERTYERLWQMLKSEDETTMKWASHFIFKLYEERALSTIRALLQSSSEPERTWALTILSWHGYIK